jgi:ribosomal protein S18 acetylase RimI-like enzyme
MHIEALTSADAAAAASVLTRAFRDNPAMVAMLRAPTDAARERLLGPCMDGFVASVLRYGTGELVKDEGRIVAVSLFFLPGTFPPPLFATVIQARGPIRAGVANAIRIARVDQAMRKRHPHYQHYYLWFLGVEPERQGRGLGSMLLRSLGARADGESAPCYLETDKLTSVKLYERHGFVVENTEPLPPLDVPFWFMKRPATK